MTIRSTNRGPTSAKVLQFPDPPPEEMTAFYHVGFPGYPASLALHFQDQATTIITSEVAAGVRPTSYEGILYPDLLIAFNVAAEANIACNGYLIPEQGKPPDFVLEVASETTARRDETVKRDAYAAMGVREYWRFDPTGGHHYQAALAGDNLIGTQYEPIAIHQSSEGRYWGHSEALNLAICWEEGDLRFWDPEAGRYLPTFHEEHASLQAAESRAEVAETRAEAAEAEVRRLREELQRSQSQ